MEEKQLIEVDAREIEILQFFRGLSSEQQDTFYDFLETLKQLLEDEKS